MNVAIKLVVLAVILIGLVVWLLKTAEKMDRRSDDDHSSDEYRKVGTKRADERKWPK